MDMSLAIHPYYFFWINQQIPQLVLDNQETAPSPNSRRGRNMSTFQDRVDTHAHFVPPVWRKALEENGHAHPDGIPAIPVFPSPSVLLSSSPDPSSSPPPPHRSGPNPRTSPSCPNSRSANPSSASPLRACTSDLTRTTLLVPSPAPATPAPPT